MTTNEILAAIDAELSRLQQARKLLSDEPAIAPTKRPGRPKGSTNKKKSSTRRKRGPKKG